MAALLVMAPGSLMAGFVYSSPGELLSSGDFNGDGSPDVVVLDRATGNARVAYQTNGVLTWSPAIPSGVPGAAAMAVGKFRDTNADAIAVTAMDLNRVHLLRLAGANPGPVPVTPIGVGPNLLAGLSAPYGSNNLRDSLIVGSGANGQDLGLALIEMVAFVGDALSAYQDSIAEQSYLETANSLLLAEPTTLLAAMARDRNNATNDSFVAYSPSNHFSLVLLRTNLNSGSQYVFGRFNGESLPRFFFYVPGQSNLLLHTLNQNGGNYLFDAGVSLDVSEAIQGVYYVARGSDGTVLIQFGDGVQGLTLPGGSPVLSSVYRSGSGAAGNVFTGIVPLTNGDFVLLDSLPGSSASSHSQVVNFNGSVFSQRSSSNLPALTSRSTRANVWLFQSEPFVMDNVLFLASSNAPDWSSSAAISGGALHVNTETDAGPSSGLGNSVSNKFGSLPVGAGFALADQYQDFISLFTYAPPRPPEPINITISPVPGLYGGPIQVSFTAVSGSPAILYRVGPTDSYHLYSLPFVLTNDTTVQYYGTNNTSRSRLFAAAYQFGRSGHPGAQPILDFAPGSSNPAPVIRTNAVILSDIGTVFYGRRGAQATIWAINLDGSGETYITTGARPRVSRDGRWLSFLREGDPFNNHGNIWVRDLVTGYENRLYTDPGTIVCYDWDLTETNLIFDFNPGSSGPNSHLWRTDLTGNAVQLGLGGDYLLGAPAVNPVDGRIAFHVLIPGAFGLYVAPADGSSKQQLNLGSISALWPAWAPDGQELVFADNPSFSSSVDNGQNLWVVQADGSSLAQITGPVCSFPHGAVFSPGGDALVGAGTIFGTNGVWIIPLTPDGLDCDGPPILLPTSAGDPIDFVGTIVAAPAPLTSVEPQLFIVLQPDAAVVYWSAAYQGFTLEYTTDLTAPTTWTPIPGPYAFDGYFFQYPEALASLAQQKFYRLHLTGVKQ